MDYSAILAPVIGMRTGLIPAMLLIGLRHLRAGNEEHERLDLWQQEAGAMDAEALQTHVQIPEPAAAELQTSQSAGSHPAVSPEHLDSVITFVGGSSTFKTEVPTNVTKAIGFSAIPSHSSGRCLARLKSTPCCSPCKRAAAHRPSPPNASMCKTSNAGVTRS